jgi:hypothetical protein
LDCTALSDVKKVFADDDEKRKKGLIKDNSIPLSDRTIGEVLKVLKYNKTVRHNPEFLQPTLSVGGKKWFQTLQETLNQ